MKKPVNTFTIFFWWLVVVAILASTMSGCTQHKPLPPRTSLEKTGLGSVKALNARQASVRPVARPEPQGVTITGTDGDALLCGSGVDCSPRNEPPEAGSRP